MEIEDLLRVAVGTGVGGPDVGVAEGTIVAVGGTGVGVFSRAEVDVGSITNTGVEVLLESPPSHAITLTLSAIIACNTRFLNRMLKCLTPESSVNKPDRAHIQGLSRMIDRSTGTQWPDSPVIYRPSSWSGALIIANSAAFNSRFETV